MIAFGGVNMRNEHEPTITFAVPTEKESEMKQI